MSGESVDTTARERLEALVGKWSMEAGPPGGPRWPGEPWVSFEWLGDTPLLLERWHVDLPEAPDGVAVIGCDGKNGNYFQLYTDERDVQRIYEMSLEDGVWKLWREGEPFDQRFTGTFSGDRDTINGRWEARVPGEDWRTDFEVVYRRAR